MSQRERRIQRIAVGFAAVAVALATTAVIARWPADRLRSDSVAPASRHVAAGELVKLKPGAIDQADGGIRVTDAALRGALGLGPGDKVALAVHVLRSQVEVERLPRYGFVNVTVPDRDFDGVNWRV